jgi:flagellar basal body-associated protein FliL
MKKEKTKKKKSKRLTFAVIIVLIFVIVFSGLFFYIWSYKNVYAIVMGTKIYYSQFYYEAVKQAEKVNFLGYDRFLLILRLKVHTGL